MERMVDKANGKVHALRLSAKKVWFISDGALSDIRDSLRPSNDAIIALGYRVVIWAHEEGFEVYLPPDLLEADEAGALALSVASAVESLIAVTSTVRKVVRARRRNRMHDLRLIGVDRNLMREWTRTAVQVARVARALEENEVTWEFPPSPTSWDPELHTDPNLSDLIAIHLVTLIESGDLAGPERPIRLVSDRSSVGRRKPLPALFRLRVAVSRFLRRARRGLGSESVERPDAIVVAYDSDLLRKRQQFAALLEKGLRVTFVPHSSRRAGNPRKTRRMGEHVDLPVDVAPIGSPISARVRAWRLRRLLRSSIGASWSLHDPFSPTRSLGNVLGQLGDRWAVLGAERAAWVRYWRRVRPRCVAVVRSVNSSSIPAFAAIEEGIDLCSVPHGVVEATWPMVPTRREGASQQVVHLTPFAVGADERECGYVPSLAELIPHEYPRTLGDKGSVVREVGKDLVLVLADQDNVLLNGLIDAREQARFVCELARCSPAFGIVVKDHPSGPLFHYAFGDDTPDNVIFADPAEDLHVAIARSSGVLLLNYWGSAAVHAFASRKPLARIRTGTAQSGEITHLRPRAMQTIADEIPLLTTLADASAFLASVSGGDSPVDFCERDRTKLAGPGPTLEALIQAAATEAGWESLTTSPLDIVT